jgi:hypothetical protein
MAEGAEKIHADHPPGISGGAGFIVVMALFIVSAAAGVSAIFIGMYGWGHVRDQSAVAISKLVGG